VPLIVVAVQLHLRVVDRSVIDGGSDVGFKVCGEGFSGSLLVYRKCFKLCNVAQVSREDRS